MELYFHTLKSGLGVEKLRYETLEGYLTALSLYQIVGWRLEYLKGAARAEPEVSCEKYFSSSEWLPVYLFASRDRSVPSHPPTMPEFLLWVAKLSGHLNRKGQGPPGSRTLWRGIRQGSILVPSW